MTLLEPYNLFTTDPVLRRALAREGAGNEDTELATFGAQVGSESVFEWGFQANRHAPELVTHDRFGERIDEVRFHPAYHQLLELSVGASIHASHCHGAPGDGSYVTRAARMHLVSQVEVGHGCPVSMTGGTRRRLTGRLLHGARSPLMRRSIGVSSTARSSQSN